MELGRPDLLRILRWYNDSERTEDPEEDEAEDELAARIAEMILIREIQLQQRQA